MNSRVNLIPKAPLAAIIKAKIPMVFIVLTIIIAIFFTSRIQSLNKQLKNTQATINKQETSRDQGAQLKQLVSNLASQKEARTALLTKKREVVARLLRIGGEKRRFTSPLLLISEVLPSTIKCQKISFSGRSGILTGTALDYLDLTGLVNQLQKDEIFSTVSLAVTDRNHELEHEQKMINFTIFLELG